MRDLIRYTFGHRGKRLRPVLVFFAGWDGGEPSADLVRAAAIVSAMSRIGSCGISRITRNAAPTSQRPIAKVSVTAAAIRLRASARKAPPSTRMPALG